MMDEYMCPFCVTPWKCNGPHIPEWELDSFNFYIEQVRQEERQHAANRVFKTQELVGDKGVILRLTIGAGSGADYVNRDMAIEAILHGPNGELDYD